MGKIQSDPREHAVIKHTLDAVQVTLGKSVYQMHACMVEFSVVWFYPSATAASWVNLTKSQAHNLDEENMH